MIKEDCDTFYEALNSGAGRGWIVQAGGRGASGEIENPSEASDIVVARVEHSGWAGLAGLAVPSFR